MKLNDLLNAIYTQHSDPELSVQGLCLESQQIKANDWFVALKGHHTDGRHYIGQAIEKGAKGVICEAQGQEKFQGYRVPVVYVDHLDQKVGQLASAFYQNPSAQLNVIGITGTNGKTTCAKLLSDALNGLDTPCAMVGTLGFEFLKQHHPSQNTTPDPIQLHRFFSTIHQQKAQCAAVEASSHGLEQGRLNGVRFESALFTNLTPEHIEYHGNMLAYGRAKMKLFEFPSLKRVVVNATDPFSKQILSRVNSHQSLGVYNAKGPSLPSGYALNTDKAPYWIGVEKSQIDAFGIRAHLTGSFGKGELRSRLLGEFNVQNLLCVLTELCLQGIPLPKALEVLNRAKPVSGRMERLGGGQSPEILIDYAHTPEALREVLQAAKAVCKRRLWVVFGCGGNRDRSKRPLMGQVASELADRIILTNDNPRQEDPQTIMEHILEGIPMDPSAEIFLKPDRKEAIRYALTHALPIDMVVIAGKGHEDVQWVGHKKIPFNDAKCVNSLLFEVNNALI